MHFGTYLFECLIFEQFWSYKDKTIEKYPIQEGCEDFTGEMIFTAEKVHAFAEILAALTEIVKEL